MKRLKSYFAILLTICLIAGLTASSSAEVRNLKLELFGFVNTDDARQIRRLLEPWAKPEDVTFHTLVDKNGRDRLFTTLVKIKPRTDKKYKESHALDVYQIVRQLRDQRFRGRPAGSQPWVVKSEATVSGDLFAHPGWARSYIRNVPFWRRWRADTSAVNHAMLAETWDQKFVFSDNDEFDQLRQDAGQSDREVEVKGVIAGFDGPYPIMSVRSYRLEQIIETKKGEPAKESAKKKPLYDYLEETPKNAEDK